MAVDNTPLSDQELDALLASVRDDTQAPSQKLIANVLADARSTAADRKPTPSAARARPRRPGLLASFLDGIGGWPGGAMIAASGLLGIWMGVSGPASLPYLDELGGELDVIVDGGGAFSPLATLDDLAMGS